jgi:tuberous sclerosis protein 2
LIKCSLLAIVLSWDSLQCVMIRGCSYDLYNIWNSVGLQALKSNHSVVTYEVILSIQRLVGKCGVELQGPSWDLVLSIVEAVIIYIGWKWLKIVACIAECNKVVVSDSNIWITTNVKCYYMDFWWFLFSETNSRTNQMSLIESSLRDTMCIIEQQIELGQFNGSVCKVFELIERCSSARPVCNISRNRILIH